jgi:catechol 2,3-dioxygenase-like lactoylglutathione lyase family enzyme
MVRTSTSLGKFSISLPVKNLEASRAFYEKLGFEMSGGKPEKGWIVLRNGNATIGLFQGMFERTMLTFNPGWDQESKPLEQWKDVREVQRELKAKGLEPAPAADESTKGPAHFMLVDPDGNPVLIDQHV